MPIYWASLLLTGLPVMVIPVAILIGQHWRSGPLVSLSACATLGVVIYLALTWTSLWSNPTDFLFGYPEAIPEVLGSAVLLLGAWALALTDAMRIRQRALAAPVTLALCAAVYASFIGIPGFLLFPARYCEGLPGGPACAPPDLGRFALFAALSLAGPLAMLIYALFVALQRQPRALPEGVTVSRLTAEEG